MNGIYQVGYLDHVLGEIKSSGFLQPVRALISAHGYEYLCVRSSNLAHDKLVPRPIHPDFASPTAALWILHDLNALYVQGYLVLYKAFRSTTILVR